jgi:sugar/nucleoside kinase (ribokinase family)
MIDKTFDLVVVGEINPDLILRGDVTPVFGQVEKIVQAADLSIGSSSVIFACGAVRLGLRVAFIGKIGKDEFGRYMRQAMEKRGIDTQGVVEDGQIHTGLSVILSTGSDRAILTYPGTMARLRMDEIPVEVVKQARHLHLGSYYLLDDLRPDIPALFNLAHTAGLTTSLDTNYDPTEKWPKDIEAVLQETDIFLPNEVECCRIAGMSDYANAFSALSHKVRILAVKQGARGASLGTENQVFHADPIPVEVVDTVGAGDSFDAGFIYGYLNEWALPRALRLAAVCGALSTIGIGGTSAQPTLAEALTYID